MKRYVLLSITLICMLFPGNSYAQKQINSIRSSFYSPDFNYPQNVIEEAETRMQQSLMSGNGNDLMRGVIQSTLAKSTISSDTLPSIIHEINEVRKRETNECIKASLYILEAFIYNKYYNLDSRKINNRNDTKTPDSSTIFEWGDSQFCDTISALIDKALSYETALKRTPITTYSGSNGFIIINNASINTYPTMFDFISWQAIKLYQQAPFDIWNTDFNISNIFKTEKKPSATIISITAIYDNLLAFHKDGSRPYIETLLSKLRFTNNLTEATASSLYHKYEDSQECAPILLDLAQWENNALKKYNLYNHYITAFPKSDFTPHIKRLSLELLKPEAILLYKSQYRSNDSIAIQCAGKNIDKINISVYIDKNSKNEIKGKPIFSTIVNFPKSSPLFDTIDVALPPLPYNRYVMTLRLIDKDGNEIVPNARYHHDKFIVSDLASFSTENHSTKDFKIFAIDAITGAPQKGVKVSSSSGKKHFGKKTDDQGYVTASGHSGNFSFAKGKDKYYNTYFTNDKWHTENDKNFDERAAIYTDFAIYRPGDTIHVSGICYRFNTTQKEPMKSQSVELSLRTSGNKVIASKQLTTDEMGRIAHDFIAPTDMMNGKYSIRLESTDKEDEFFAFHTITISEYKTPSFYVDFIDKKATYPDSGLVTLRGNVTTFSGMPIANANVECSLQSRVWWGQFTTDATTSVSTDETGNFSLTFNTTDLIKSQNKFMTYRITATATDNLGEAQSGNIDFHLGKSLVMLWSGEHSTFFSNNPDNSLPIKVIDNSEKPADNFECEMTLTDTHGNIIKSTSFFTNKPQIDLSGISNGKYTLKVWLKQDSSINVTQNITIFNPSDNNSPVERPLWYPDIEYTCVPGDDGVIYLANSFNESHVYYTISCESAIIKDGWMTLPKGVTKFHYTMPKESRSNTLIEFHTAKKMQSYSSKINITPIVHKPVATLSATSFRDKITAGDTEKWTLHLDVDGKKTVGSAIIAAMTDKAINSLLDNTWKFAPQLRINTTWSSLTGKPIATTPYSYSLTWNTALTDSIAKLPNRLYITQPTFQMYDMRYFKPISKRNQMVFHSLAYAALVNDEDAFVVKNRGVMLLEKSEATETQQDISDVTVRVGDIKTAFWKPMLTTDENGNVNIEFEAPNMNTTWMFQAIGYDKDMNAATLLKDVVCNKPLMVTSNMPRFVRSGDKITLMGGVQNITDSTMLCTASIDIFNPFDNTVFATRNVDCTVEAKETVPVSIKYAVPDTVSAIGFRIRATNGTFSDGEQVMIPVLPSISPVIESKPFYVLPDSTSLSIKLPDFPDKAKISFEYCDNPIWYVATALPVINESDQITVTGLAHTLFAQLTTNKIVKEHPQIAEALEYWKTHPQDSALVSMLDKNQELKISSLISSPWINDSEEQTLRMSQLYTLFNEAKSEKTTKKIIDKIAEFQQSDGGFIWIKYPNAKSSLNTTLTVAQLLGEIKSLDAIDKNEKFDNIVKRAVAYLDTQLIERYNNRTDKLNFAGYSDFAYTRSLFTDIAMSATVKDLYENIIKSLAKEWNSMNIVNKAYAAITLANSNQADAAKPIIESIDQFSIYRPATGRYWDYFSSGWYNYYSKVTLTSLILQAYTKVIPQSQHIDQIRQWLLLEKQTTDWGNSSLAADAVYALLTSGNNWLKFAEAPQFTLNGKPFELNSLDRILGYGKVQLNLANSARNVISINRHENNSPAWGAVYAQYNAPMNTIKAASSALISLKKDVINLSGKELKVGDKVQIRLTITNSRNLEYVTLTDERASCLEPAEQISGYRYQDGNVYYLEIKDSETNLFFHYLPKGTHVITYETYVTNSGTFNSGIATIQCQYAPQITAHSAGAILSAK